MLFLVVQGGRRIAAVEAVSEESAIARAKGLSGVVDFSASAPFEVSPSPDDQPPGVPTFRSEYFEMLGYVR